MFPAVDENVGLVIVYPVAGYDGSHDGLTHTGWESPNTATSRTPVWPVQDFLDLAAGDVLAAGFDHVLFAVHDVQQAVLVV